MPKEPVAATTTSPTTSVSAGTIEPPASTGNEEPASAVSFFSAAFDALNIKGSDESSESVPAKETKPIAEAPEKKVSGEPALKKELAASEILSSLSSDAPAEKNTVEEPLPEDLKNASGKAQNRFIALKKENKTITAELRAVREELAAERAKKAEADPVVLKQLQEELTSLRATSEEQDRELAVSRLEATRQYKQAVVQPLAEIRESVKSIADKTDVSVEDIFSAFESSESDQLVDMSAGMNDRDRLRIYSLADEYAKVQRIKKVAQENAKEALERIRAADETRSKEELERSKSEYAKAQTEVWNQLKSQIPIFNKSEDAENPWNQEIDAIESYASQVDLSVADPKVRAGIAYRAALAPSIFKLVLSLKAENDRLASELTGLRTASPALGGGNSGESDSESTGDESFLSVLKSKLT